MFPEGWQSVTIASACEKVSVGIVVNPSHYYVDQNEGIRAFRSGNVRENRIQDDRWVYLSREGHAKNKKSELREGDVLIVRTGFAGVACVVPKRLAGSNCIDILFARPNPSKLIPEYLAELTNSEVGRRQVLSGQSGLAQKHLNVAAYEKMSFGLPPVWEQKQIVLLLNTWNDSIVALERILDNSHRQRLALLAATLHSAPANGDASGKAANGGFPVSVQPGIPSLCPTPSGWRRIYLGDHLREIRRPVTLKDAHLYSLVTVKRSRGGVHLREVLSGAAIKTPSQFYVHNGDFLISKRQIVHGACGIVPPELNGAVVSNEYAVLSTDGQIDLKFLRYLSESRYFQQTCFHSSIGVHVEKMIFKTERWLAWPFNIPPLAEQKRVVEILDAASKEVELIQSQLAALKQEKAALMSQLLTGKRRVRQGSEVVCTP